MKKFFLAIVALSMVCSLSASAFATDGDWNTVMSGSWSDAGNWNPVAVPDGAGATVNLLVNISGGPTTVTINGGILSPTVGILNIGDPNNTDAYILAAINAGTLTFNNGGVSQLNQVATSAGDTISVPLLLNDSLIIANASGNALTISGTITANAAGVKTITNNGAGSGGVTLSGVIADGGTGSVAVTQSSGTSALTLSGVNTYTGGYNYKRRSIEHPEQQRVGSDYQRDNCYLRRSPGNTRCRIRSCRASNT